MSVVKNLPALSRGLV